MDPNVNLELQHGGSDSSRIKAEPQPPKTTRDEDEITPVIAPAVSQQTLVGNDGIDKMTLNTVLHSTPNGEGKAVVPPQPPGSKSVAPQANVRLPENYVVAPENLSETPDFVDCPWCQKRQKTKVVHTDSSQTTLAALFCCLCCGVITACIPFCFHWFGDTEHLCGGCNRCVARRPHDGKMEAVKPQRNDPLHPKIGPSQFAPMTMQAKKNLDPKTNND